jgi:hypothetical protein
MIGLFLCFDFRGKYSGVPGHCPLASAVENFPSILWAGALFIIFSGAFRTFDTSLGRLGCDGGSKIFCNFGVLVHHHTVSKPRGIELNLHGSENLKSPLVFYLFIFCIDATLDV